MWATEHGEYVLHECWASVCEEYSGHCKALHRYGMVQQLKQCTHYISTIDSIPESTFAVPQVPSSAGDGSKPDKHTTCKVLHKISFTELICNEMVNLPSPPPHTQGHLSARFSTLMQKLWSGKFSSLHPEAFKKTLGIMHPQFADNRQVTVPIFK